MERNVIYVKDNISIFLYEGEVFYDFECTRRYGSILVEQTFDSTLNDTMTTHNVYLPEGALSYRYYHKSNGGKTQTDIIGPVICGDEKFLFWNSSNFYTELLLNPDNDTRTVTIYKKMT